MPCSFLLDFLVVPGKLGLLAWAEIARGRVSSGVSKHVAQRPQKPQGLLGTGRRGSVIKRVCVCSRCYCCFATAVSQNTSCRFCCWATSWSASEFVATVFHSFLLYLHVTGYELHLERRKKTAPKKCIITINPFTAMLAEPSLGKRPQESIKAFLSPSHKHVKGFLSKCVVLKTDLLQDRQI